MLGWSGEVESNVWRKADITMDEGDLIRLLRDADLPEEIAPKLSLQVAHLLLDTQVEMALTYKLRSFGYPAEVADARMNVLKGQQQTLISGIRDQVSSVSA